ncbi:MAG: hypothetical protein QXF01_01675 [Candidatus Micrarchaeaceae archaeon]
MAGKASSYILVLIIALLALIAIYEIINYKVQSHSFFGTTSTTTVYTNATNSTPTNSTQPTTIYSNSSGCLSPSNVSFIPNGNFSSGTFSDWNATGVGFGTAPVNIIYANQNGDYYSAPWSGYNGTFFATTHRPGTLVAIGNITSEPFEVVQPYLNFQIISPQSNNLYIEILLDGKPFIINHYDTLPAASNLTAAQSTFENASIPLAPLICKNIRIRVVAGIVKQRIGTNYEFIAVGNFYMSKTPNQNPQIVVNRTVV